MDELLLIHGDTPQAAWTYPPLPKQTPLPPVSELFQLPPGDPLAAILHGWWDTHKEYLQPLICLDDPEINPADDPTVVPIPPALGMFLIGALGIAMIGRKRR